MIRTARRGSGILALTLCLTGCGTVFKEHLEASRQLAAACETLSKLPPAPTQSFNEYLESLEARAWPMLKSCPDASTMLEPPKVSVLADPPAVPLLTCGLNQKLFEHKYRREAQSWANKIRPVASRLRDDLASAEIAWVAVREVMNKEHAEIAQALKNPQPRPAFMVRDVSQKWGEFEVALVTVLKDAEELDKAVRDAQVDATWRSFQVDLLAYTENLRVSVGKIRRLAFDQAQIVRDQLTGRISENFAIHYLRALDRSLAPLERGFDRFDEKVYGLGTLGAAGLSGSIDEALLSTYRSAQDTLCRDRCNEMREPGQMDAVVEAFVQAVGRAACKRLDEPTDVVSSPMLMQYVYRFHARIAAATVGRAPSQVRAEGWSPEPPWNAMARAEPRGLVTKVNEANDPKVRNAQFLQHAVAEWTVREAFLVQDLSEQVRVTASPSSAAGSPTLPGSLLARAPNETSVESRARQQAAMLAVEAWAKAPKEGVATAFENHLSVQNNIAVSQQVSVQVVNQQSVINNIRFDSASSAGHPDRGSVGRVRFDPAVIQVNVPTQQRAAVSSCAGADLGRCGDINNGFRWRIGGFDLGSDALPAGATDEIDHVRLQIERLLAGRPGLPLTVEVHGFASPEPFRCDSLQSRGRGKSAVPGQSAYAPACTGTASANPQLSFQRATEVWKRLKMRVPAQPRLHFAPPFAHGDSDPASGRVVEIRVFASP